MPYDASFTAPDGSPDPAAYFRRVSTAFVPQRKDLEQAGQWLVAQIKQRTLRDESLNGGNFVPYSPAYARSKGQTNVDLYSKYSHAHMLDSLQARVENVAFGQTPDVTTELDVGIFDNPDLAARARLHDQGSVIPVRQRTTKSKRKANIEQAATSFNMPQRQFLGATADDMNHIGEMLLGDIRQRWMNYRTASLNG